MKTIQLTKGFVATVDDEDFEALAQYRWHANIDGYATRTQWVKGGKGKKINIFMHHAIVGRKDGFEVDHKNGDRRDNRQENLRFATSHQNKMNAKRKPNKTGFKGIVRESANCFIARMRVNGQHKHIGTFKTAEEAYSAYCQAAVKEFGEFARLN